MFIRWLGMSPLKNNVIFIHLVNAIMYSKLIYTSLVRKQIKIMSKNTFIR